MSETKTEKTGIIYKINGPIVHLKKDAGFIKKKKKKLFLLKKTPPISFTLKNMPVFGLTFCFL